MVWCTTQLLFAFRKKIPRLIITESCWKKVGLDMNFMSFIVCLINFFIAGYSYYGTEKLYSGIDGREMDADIFFGVVHYQRLRHMVSDKFQVYYLSF